MFNSSLFPCEEQIPQQHWYRGPYLEIATFICIGTKRHSQTHQCIILHILLTLAAANDPRSTQDIIHFCCSIWFQKRVPELTYYSMHLNTCNCFILTADSCSLFIKFLFCLQIPMVIGKHEVIPQLNLWVVGPFAKQLLWCFLNWHSHLTSTQK